MLSRTRAYSGVCSRPGTACEEYSRITLARAEYAMNACDQSGNASRYTYGQRSISNSSATNSRSRTRVSSSVGFAPVARSSWAIRLPTTWASAPTSVWVSPAASRSLRRRDPKRAAMEDCGSIALAMGLLPILTARTVRRCHLPRLGRAADS
ncbi:hypothetical protein SCALM49S_01050 [Streptomyces californicus]